MSMRDYPFVFPVKEAVYKVIGGRKLRFFVFEPDTGGMDRAAVLFFLGGPFGKTPNTPADFQYHAAYLASKGYVAICVECRTGQDEGFTPVQAICDARSAVRRLRGHASEWGIDPQKIVVCASSSGGYTAVSAIMFDHLNDEGDDPAISPVPDALVIFAAGMDAVDITERLYPELLSVPRTLFSSKTGTSSSGWLRRATTSPGSLTKEWSTGFSAMADTETARSTRPGEGSRNS